MEYAYKRADGADAVYKDNKRYLWLLTPLANYAVPFLVMALFLTQGQNPLWIVAIPVYFYVVIPGLDWLMGEDRFNPPEEVVPALSVDNYYRIVAWSSIPLFYAVYITGMWFVMTQNLPLWAQIVFVLGIGLVNGNANTIGHELGHKTNKLDQLGSQLALISIGNGHFAAEHNKNHHIKVSTPEDCSSSRMGETLYEFALRDMPGAARGAWALEKKRLANTGKKTFSHHNQLLMSWSASIAIAVLLALWLGWAVLPFIALYKFQATFTLTLANYVEHYGLLRQKRENGRYEPCAPHHSWNTNHIFSNLSTIHLQRHSDHHANPMRPYQALRNFDGVPELPSGYPGVFGLAHFPPLWFKVMDPKVMKWANGDITKVNIDPRKQEALYKKYGAVSG